MPNDMLAQLAAERVARHGPPRAIDAALLEAAQDANPVALRRALASANAMRFDLRWHGAEHDVAAEALFDHPAQARFFKAFWEWAKASAAARK